MSVLFFLFLFLAAFFIFGGVFAAALFGERRVFALVPLGVIIGLNAYIFLVNLIAHAIPLAITVWLVLGLMLAAAGVLYWAARRDHPAPVVGGLEAHQLRWLFLIAAVISLVSGVISLRTLQYEDLSLGHLPLAATINAGNFPVMDPSAPDQPMAYHYVSDLFTVALHKITGTPLWLGYDIQTFLMSGVVFLMAFLLAWHLRRNFWSSLAAAFLLFYGGGLIWLYFTEGLGPLWQTYVSGREASAPWKFAASMTIPQLWSGFVFIMNNHAIEIGLAITVFVLYCLVRALASGEQRWLTFTLVGAVSFGYLALSAETNFVVLGAAFLLALAVEILFRLRHRREPGEVFFWGRHAVAVMLIMLGVGVLLAAFQGGVLSSFGSGGLTRSFSVVPRFWVIDFAPRTGPFLIGSWPFWVELGLSPLLLLPALYFFRRERPILFLALPAVLAFAVPFFLRYLDSGEPKRLFGSLAIPLFSFLAGLFLIEVWPQVKGLLGRFASRRLVPLLLFLAVSSSLLFQLVYLLTPLGHVGKFRRPFLEIPGGRSPLDERAYRWIREHTTLADRFFPYDKNGTKFIRETGRFLPGEINMTTKEMHYRQKEAYRAILDSCDASGFREMRIAYVYLSPDFPSDAENFETQCLSGKLGAQLVYRDEQESDFRRIYRLPGPPVR